MSFLYIWYIWLSYGYSKELSDGEEFNFKFWIGSSEGFLFCVMIKGDISGSGY